MSAPSPSPSAAPQGPVVQVDIVSDVMCPWCIIGYKQLEQALGMTRAGAYVRWHPFELNPTMPPEGQDLTEHMAQKYGSTAAQSQTNRERITEMAAELGVTFNFTPDSRIVNTFAAHQLLDYAQDHGVQHPLKMALFEAYFDQRRDVSDHAVLVDVAGSVGLDVDTCRTVLQTGSHAEQTRARQQFWTAKGISGVPSMIFDGKYLLTGAQGAQTYAQMLLKVIAEKDAA